MRRHVQSQLALLFHGLAHLFYHHSALRQLLDVLLRRNRFVWREHSRLSDLAARLHLPRDRERVTRRSLHRADAVFFVVVVHHLPTNTFWLSAFRAFREHTHGDEIVSVRLGESWPHRGNDEIARDDFHSLHINRLELEQSELANR